MDTPLTEWFDDPSGAQFRAVQGPDGFAVQVRLDTPEGVERDRHERTKNIDSLRMAMTLLWHNGAYSRTVRDELLESISHLGTSFFRSMRARNGRGLGKGAVVPAFPKQARRRLRAREEQDQ